jgi:hydroxymethylglutaryl-CoA lyase
VADVAALPDRVSVREVGPRDGLQAEPPVAVADRIRLIDALIAAGVADIEVAAFVSPKAVPAMVGAGEVVAAVAARRGLRRWALVPNVRGAELALDFGVDGLTMTVSASETYSQRNVHLSVAESVAEAARVCALAQPAEVPVDVVLSCAFGSPYDGDIAAEDVAALTGRLTGGGAARVTLADTTGMATPRRLHDVLGRTGLSVGLHLHETRGTGLVNAYAALEAGVARFDTSVGGLGGSPFAAGSAGNLATEALVYLCDDLGIATGIDLERLLAAAALAQRIVGHALPSPVAVAGPRSRRAVV